MFLINLLQGLGLETWLSRHPPLRDGDWPRALLRSLADQLAVPASDPMRLGLGLESPEDNAAREAGLEPALAKAISRHWRRRLGRWCARPGRPRLLALVRRPGAVVASRTHLEVWFDLGQAQIDVRRAGLDLDPGWVPWLGLVVRFHYERGLRLPGQQAQGGGGWPW
jgi:hypothetical protein